jgi:hypothetical protein
VQPFGVGFAVTLIETKLCAQSYDQEGMGVRPIAGKRMVGNVGVVMQSFAILASAPPFDHVDVGVGPNPSLQSCRECRYAPTQNSPARQLTFECAWWSGRLVTSLSITHELSSSFAASADALAFSHRRPNR